MKYVKERLVSLRAELKNRKIDAIIIPGNDPHFSEYPAKCWQYRKWISGFTGSAGTLTITQGDAALWVDSRYFIQARKQLEGTGITMQKLVPGRLFDESWLKTRLGNGSRVGADAKLFSINMFKSLKQSLSPLILTGTGDIFDSIYAGRPPLPESAAFLLSDEITGKSRKEKLADFAKTITPNSEIYIVSALDEIAWLLNMRGSDIAYNPVAVSYLITDYPAAHLFIGEKQLHKSDLKQLSCDGVSIHPYSDFDRFVSSIAENRTVKLNFDKTNFHIYELLKDRVTTVEEKNGAGSADFRKAVKNKVELAGFRTCMIADGVAMFRFIKWLNDNVGKIRITETEAAEKLEEFRKQGDNYRGPSFRTISAYGANGALPHYSPEKSTDAEIGTDAFYLVDSGAQYLTGTTDITRTLHFGNPSDREKEDYTLVLKGMINLSMAVFPAGTRGAQLDILARKFLWEKGKNYLHGTGHGVGHYLNVHEGPQSIRCEENTAVFMPGMVTSCEPAIYVEGKYGIRTENLIACEFYRNTGYGDFYSFNTLTICPIDTKSINISMMAEEEIKWLNGYHKRVYDTLSPYLEKEEVEYLKTVTAPI
jgi:Xaa-Pro aminopeptidase